ncbi:MAG: catalase-peroxidase, partial [Flavobacteriaceae bacterium]|nr:catalase-peroxidase [Flavobacteriaceae bacterium]
MEKHAEDGAAKCPFTGATTLSSKQGSAGTGPVNRDWWPNQLKLNILRQHSSQSNPMDKTFNYVSEFKSLDLKAVKQD